jgi:hypothetical protein
MSKTHGTGAYRYTGPAPDGGRNGSKGGAGRPSATRSISPRWLGKSDSRARTSSEMCEEGGLIGPPGGELPLRSEGFGALIMFPLRFAAV